MMSFVIWIIRLIFLQRLNKICEWDI